MLILLFFLNAFFFFSFFRHLWSNIGVILVNRKTLGRSMAMSKNRMLKHKKPLTTLLLRIDCNKVDNASFASTLSA